jgi:predicted small lipoprotein YifL
MMKHTRGGALTVILLAALAASGCGLKGTLTLPSKSDEVIIRAPGQAAPAEPAKAAPAKPRDERIPPPPLPGGNPGTTNGG